MWRGVGMSAGAKRVVARFLQAFVKAPQLGQVKASLANLKKKADEGLDAVLQLKKVFGAESDNFFDQFEHFPPYVAQNAESTMEDLRTVSKGVLSFGDVEDLKEALGAIKKIKHPGKEVDPGNMTGLLFEMADAALEGIDEFYQADIQPFTWWARSLEQTALLAEAYTKTKKDAQSVQALQRAAKTVRDLDFYEADLVGALNTVINTVASVAKSIR